MNDKTPSQLTSEIIDRMKQSQQFRIMRPVPDDFEFRGGPVPFTISINAKGVMTFTVYAVSLEEANRKINAYLNPYDGDESA